MLILIFCNRIKKNKLYFGVGLWGSEWYCILKFLIYLRLFWKNIEYREMFMFKYVFNNIIGFVYFFWLLIIKFCNCDDIFLNLK